VDGEPMNCALAPGDRRPERGLGQRDDLTGLGKRCNLTLLKISSPSSVTSNRPLAPVRRETSIMMGAHAPRISAARPTACSR